MKVTRRFTFEAAHRLEGYDGPCARVHGHSYKVEITLRGPLDGDGMVVDFSRFKEWGNQVLAGYDHVMLNDFMNGEPATAENMAYNIFESLEALLAVLNEHYVKVDSVKLWETENCWVEYNGD